MTSENADKIAHAKQQNHRRLSRSRSHRLWRTRLDQPQGTELPTRGGSNVVLESLAGESSAYQIKGSVAREMRHYQRSQRRKLWQKSRASLLLFIPCFRFLFLLIKLLQVAKGAHCGAALLLGLGDWLFDLRFRGRWRQSPGVERLVAAAIPVPSATTIARRMITAGKTFAARLLPWGPLGPGATRR